MCGSAQQRRDQLHDARAASEAGPDLQAVSTPELTAPRERSVGRERRCFIGPLRAAARGGGGEAEPVSAACRIFRCGRACGERGHRRAAREPGSGRLRRAGRSAAAVGRRESAFKGQLGAGGLFASLSLARKAPRAQLARKAVSSAGTQGASCASRRRAQGFESTPEPPPIASVRCCRWGVHENTTPADVWRCSGVDGYDFTLMRGLVAVEMFPADLVSTGNCPGGRRSRSDPTIFDHKPHWRLRRRWREGS